MPASAQKRSKVFKKLVLFDHASAAVSDCAVSLDRVFIRLEAIATIKTIDPCKHYIGIKYLFL